MEIVALTGGIATGKSTVCRLLSQSISGLVIFDCDASVRELLDVNPAVASRISDAFTGEALSSDGTVNRNFLRERVFRNREARVKLENILHPLVRQECLASLASAGKQGARLFVADVPLLFEKGFDFGHSQVIVVATSRSSQIQRLKARNGFDDQLIDSILASQLPLQKKMSHADMVFWNEGPLGILHSQISRFSQEIS